MSFGGGDDVDSLIREDHDSLRPSFGGSCGWHLAGFWSSVVGDEWVYVSMGTNVESHISVSIAEVVVCRSSLSMIIQRALSATHRGCNVCLSSISSPSFPAHCQSPIMISATYHSRMVYLICRSRFDVVDDKHSYLANHGYSIEQCGPHGSTNV